MRSSLGEAERTSAASERTGSVRRPAGETREGVAGEIARRLAIRGVEADCADVCTIYAGESAEVCRIADLASLRGSCAGPAALRRFRHAAQVHGIQLVDGVLHERCDHVRGLRVHDSIVAVRVE